MKFFLIWHLTTENSGFGNFTSAFEGTILGLNAHVKEQDKEFHSGVVVDLGTGKSEKVIKAVLHAVQPLPDNTRLF